MANLIDETDPNQKSCGKAFQPKGLMAHLEKKGEICILHFGTRKYLEKLYEKRKHLSYSTSFFCDGKGEGLLLSNGERPNPFPEHKLWNSEVANTLQSIPPGTKKYVTTQIVKGKSQHVLNSSHSSCFFHGERLFLSNGERPNPIPEIRLLAREDMASKLADISNPVLDVMTKIKSKGKSGMVKYIALVEENANIHDVFREAGISRHWAMGKEVQGLTDSSGNNAGGGFQDQLAEGLAERPLERLVDQPLVKPTEKPADHPPELQVKEPTEQAMERDRGATRVNSAARRYLDDEGCSSSNSSSSSSEEELSKIGKQPAEQRAKQPPHQPVDQSAGHPSEQQPAKQQTKERASQATEQPAKQLADHPLELQVKEPIEQAIERDWGATHVNSAARRYLDDEGCSSSISSSSSSEEKLGKSGKPPSEQRAKQPPHQPVDQRADHPSKQQPAKQQTKERASQAAEQPAK